MPSQPTDNTTSKTAWESQGNPAWQWTLRHQGARVGSILARGRSKVGFRAVANGVKLLGVGQDYPTLQAAQEAVEEAAGVTVDLA